jgi:hypothetical protein
MAVPRGEEVKTGYVARGSLLSADRRAWRAARRRIEHDQ